MTGDGHIRQMSPGEELSVLELVNILLRQRRLVVSIAVALPFLFVLITLLAPREYTSTLTFLSQAEQTGLSGLSGIAAQFGLNVGTGSNGQSPAFYVELLQSREILGQIALDSFRFRTVTGFAWWRDTSTARGSPMDLFDIDRDQPLARRRELAIEKLREAADATSDRETGIVSLRVTTRWPELSRAIVDRAFELVSEFDLQKRQSRAAAERRFVEERLEAARGELRGVENRLERFLQQNRDFRNSPSLQFEHDRLQREVSLQQQVVISLVQGYEQARIEEVRNTPVTTVIEVPEVPARPSKRRLLLKGLLALILGGVVGVFAALGREVMMAGRRLAPDEFQEFMRLRAAAVDDLRRLALFRRRPEQSDAAGQRT